MKQFIKAVIAAWFDHRKDIAISKKHFWIRIRCEWDEAFRRGVPVV